jgi:hypothetical protein
VQTTDKNKHQRQMSTGMYEKKKDKINRTYQASWIEFMGGRENEERAPETKWIGQRRYTNHEQMKIKRQ